MSELTVEAEEDKIVQQPVGIVTKSPVEDLATYARKKAAALNQISELQDQVVLGTAGWSQQMKSIAQ